MKFEGAVIKEKGVKFAIVIVKRHIIQNSSKANQTIREFQPVFPDIPVLLMAQDSRGIPTYYGRKNISKLWQMFQFTLFPERNIL